MAYKKYINFTWQLVILLLIPLAMVQAQDNVNEDNLVDLGLSHRITLVNAGSRSEGIRETLIWKGKELPEIFQEVRAYGYRWELKVNKQVWGRSGYCNKGETDRPQSTLNKLTENELNQGWKEGRWEEKAMNMPYFWIAARRETLIYWLNPEKADQLAKKFNWKPITN